MDPSFHLLQSIIFHLNGNTNPPFLIKSTDWVKATMARKNKTKTNPKQDRQVNPTCGRDTGVSRDATASPSVPSRLRPHGTPPADDNANNPNAIAVAIANDAGQRREPSYYGQSARLATLRSLKETAQGSGYMMKPVPRKARKGGGGGKGGGDDGGGKGGGDDGGDTRSVAEASSTSKGMFYNLFVSYVFGLIYIRFVCIAEIF